MSFNSNVDQTATKKPVGSMMICSYGLKINWSEVGWV